MYLVCVVPEIRNKYTEQKSGKKKSKKMKKTLEKMEKKHKRQKNGYLPSEYGKLLILRFTSIKKTH